MSVQLGVPEVLAESSPYRFLIARHSNTEHLAIADRRKPFMYSHTLCGQERTTPWTRLARTRHPNSALCGKCAHTFNEQAQGR
jgi:hypothetical protein